MQSSKLIPCIECKEGYNPHPNWHHKSGLCSRKCKLKRHNKIARAWDKSPKGIEAEKRWRLNPHKKIIDKRARSKSTAKEKNVQRALTYAARSEYFKREKKRLDRLRRLLKYNKSGPYRKWWRKNVKKGCKVCGYKGSDGKGKNLGFDHIIPRKKGGTDELKNLQILCAKHNAEKGWGREKTSAIWKK